MTMTISGNSGLIFPDGSGQETGIGRNRIINGDMRIDQRNAGASSTPTGSIYVVDRWNSILTQASKLTIGQNLNSVTTPVGFSNYAGFQSTSAYSVTAGDYFIMRQNIEGYNFSDLGFGTADAKTVTLSFWVRSSLTGTFGGAFCNYAFTRSYPFTYTISSANTWEQKTITIAGDTSGTWVGSTNAGAASLSFGLGVGSTNSGTAGSWQSASLTSATGATSVVGTNGATFYITGVQLEVGSTATPFERRLYGTELALCQRYFWYLGGATASGDQYLASGHCPTTINARVVVHCPVSMRASPTVSAGTASNYQVYAGDAAPTVTALAIGGVSTSTDQVTSFGLSAVVASGLTLGRGCTLLGINTSAKITFSSEL